LVLKPVATLAAIAFVLSNYPAFGQEAAKPSDRTDCEKFSWRVDREHDWFADKNLPRRASGARLRRIDRAVDLSLRPARQVDLFLPPDVKPRPDSFSGEVTFFGVPKPGLYQVTLSDQATIGDDRRFREWRKAEGDRLHQRETLPRRVRERAIRTRAGRSGARRSHQRVEKLDQSGIRGGGGGALTWR